MIHPIAHPFCIADDYWLRLHRRELDGLVERRHPSIWKLCR